MNRNVTAIYRTHSTADLVRRELEKLGVSRSDIHVVPDTESPATDRERYMDDLHDLHLPDDDVRTYQHSVRSGDHVVSANVDEDQVEHARRIMSRPEAEAYDLSARDTEFRDETLIAHSDAARPASQRDWVGEREESNDPYVRSYARRSSVDRNPGV